MMKVIILNPVFLRGSLSVCKLFHFPCRYKPQFLTLLHRLHYQSPQKVFCRNLSRLGVAFYSFDEMPGENNEENMKGTELLHLMEARGIRGNGQTYLWLLDCCSNSGSFIECMKLHGKIIKVGFDRESVLCDKLIDIYLEEGDLSCVIKVFDDMAERSVHTWNKVLSGFLEKKMSYRVLGLFSRMVEEDVSLSEITFSSVLRACVGADVEFSLVEQIHAKIICHGFFASPNVSNPLIDLYAKKGLLRSAEKVFSNLRSKDSVSWLAMISGYSQNGHEEEAVKLFCKMLASRNLTTPYVLSSVLSACTKREFFDIGEQLHALVFKQRFSSETYVCNALVTLYCRFGKFLSAEQVFSRMLRKDSVSYNSLISGLSQQGFSDKALELFEKMQADLLKPDCVTVASVLSACASTGALCKGEQLHAHVIKSGMSSDIIIEGALLDLYVKCSDVRTAHNFFLTTQTENVVLYNVMLVAYGQLDDLSESLFVFSQLQNRGLIPNEFTYPSILRTCTSVGALDLGEQIHTQVIKTGFQFNVYVCSVLIDMYAKNGKLDTARGILERLTEADVVSWTAMIAGCTQHELHSEALNYFKEMIERGIQSDNIGLSSAISACAGIQALSQGRQVHARSYVSGYAKDLSIGNALVILYARCGRTQEAYLAFEKIHARDGISWNALISGFVQCGHCEEALKVFVRMNRESVEASLFTFGSVVSAAANVANIKQGKQVHAMVIKSGFDSEIEVCNALITLYSKCGSINHAQREFSDMPLKNDVSWNAMITAYSQHGYAKEALNVFEKMKQAGQVPNHVTFVGVLSACSHVGLVDEGLGYFWSMSREHGLVPKPTHYACVVDLLSRAGFLSRARDFIEEMPIEPNATIWRTLLSFCTVYKNIEVGEFAACHLLELEPEDSATYVLLSNMYAVSGRWDHRDQTRKLMKDRGVKKEPGRSWIEVKNTIHAFFVGDKLHPLADKIYEYLADLNRRAAEIGYIQDQYSLLNESEQGVKDQTQYIHSEKLAITFGLLSLGKAEPIRVMKNLRVCNDCHNWIKFASKISDRPIVVRDAYRFHHFEGGVCSCGDYW